MSDAEHARAVAALRFRALGDETRLRLLEILAHGQRNVGELMELTTLGQSLVSHHLRILRQAGLVTVRREGRWAHYDVAPAGLTAAANVVSHLTDD